MDTNLFNLIVIEGGNYGDIKKALQDWIDLSDGLLSGVTFKLYKNGNSKHLIQTDELNNRDFYSLVNYLKYPIDIKYEVDVKGFTIDTDNNILKNKKLLVFLPPTGKFDNVYVATSEYENYQIDFINDKIKESWERNIYRQPIGLTFENPEILTVEKKQKDSPPQK
jgi:hypothetical protein